MKMQLKKNFWLLAFVVTSLKNMKTFPLYFALLSILLALPDVSMAQSITPAAPDFDKNTLYWVTDGSTATGNYATAFKFNGLTTTSSGASITSSSIYSMNGSSGWNGANLSTMAVGPWDHDNNPATPDILVAYHWYFGAGGNTVARVTPGQTAVEIFTVPLPGTASYNYWSGGEVNQLTGEIYFCGGEDACIGGSNSSFRLMIYNPKTNTYRRSRILQPRTTSDAAGVSTGTGNYVMSDMALDADGNIYILVGGSSTKWLVRVVPGSNDGNDWYFNKVVEISGLPIQIWGMSSLDGFLYAISDVGVLYRINVLSGTAANIKTISPAAVTLDLACAQTTTVIQGKVYNDANGDGIISQTEKDALGVPNVTVEIYDKNGVRRGSRVTDGSGEYSYLLDSNNSDYYIRIKRPKINGIKAVQTYASAGNFSNALASYTITAYTNDGTNNNIPMTSTAGDVSGPCLGAHFGADPDTEVLNDALIYSKVEIRNDRIVANVNFGLTAISDFGDAPDTYATLLASNGPAHLTHQGFLWLGANVSTDTDGKPSPNADADQFDDGVFVVLNGNEIAVSDTVLECGTTYNFKVYTSGPLQAKGYLNAWISCNSSGVSGATFTHQVANNLQPNSGGIITFTYAVPTLTNPSSPGKYRAYMRFRFSNAPSMTATGNPDPSAADNYWGIYGEVEDYGVYIRRRIPVPTGSITWPSANLTYGQNLNQANMSGGSASAPYSGGVFSFVNGNAVFPKVSDSGVTPYSIVYTPPNYDAYAPVTYQITVSVNRKSITATGFTAAGKYYDGTVAAWVKSVTFDGLEFSESLSIGTDYTASANFDNPNIANGKPVAIVTITLSNSPKSNNYTINNSPIFTFTTTADILNEPATEGVVIGSIEEVYQIPLKYSILSLESGLRGLRLPRLTSNARDLLSNSMTSDQKTEAGGLLIFNMDESKIQFWNKTEWRSVEAVQASVSTGTQIPKNSGNVLIGKVEKPNYFSLLEIESDSQGLFLPSLNEEKFDAMIFYIDSNGGGLFAFDETPGKESITYWNGTSWVAVAGTSVISGTPTGNVQSKLGVNIGEDATPEYYTILKLSSKIKGLRLPQLTSVARNNLLPGATAEEKAAAAGLLIYNNDTNKLEYYDGTNWYTF
jgi:hypothetical protein